MHPVENGANQLMSNSLVRGRLSISLTSLDARRQALELAIRVCGDMPNPDNVVSCAKIFEQYLCGGGK